MNRTCPSCNFLNPPNACFCTQCRASLAQGTTLRQPTMLAPPPPGLGPVPTPVAKSPNLLMDTKTILQRVTQAYGLSATQPVANQAFGIGGVGRPGQHEDTIPLTDVSVSMREKFNQLMNKLEAAQEAVLNMVRQKACADPTDRVAIASFSDEGRLHLPLQVLQTHQSAIENSIRGLTIEGGTDINEGLKVAESAFDWDRMDVVRRIVLLTDGQGGDPIRTADMLKSRGVVIDCIGIGPDPSEVNEDLLRKIASVIQGRCRYRFITDSQTLVKHYTMLANKTAIR